MTTDLKKNTYFRGIQQIFNAPVFQITPSVDIFDQIPSRKVVNKAKMKPGKFTHHEVKVLLKTGWPNRVVTTEG